MEVRLNAGNWQPLTKQSWGGWAASYHAPKGTVVQFRATGAGGETDLSDCYKWIPAANTDATVVTCPNQPPPSQFSATVSNVQGNAYWIEAVATGNQPIHGVWVIFNCSTTEDPHDMDYHADWGKWTLGRSTPIPAGTKVTFEVLGETGNWYSQGYIWPNATPASGCT